jgi:hypothetical protein
VPFSWVVRFDPADPGDESSIPVGFGPATEVEEILAKDGRKARA